MEAINSKHQVTVNRAIQWLVKHNEANDNRDLESDTNGEDTKEFKKIDRLCEKTFDKFLDYMSELPKREQQAIYKSDLY